MLFPYHTVLYLSFRNPPFLLSPFGTQLPPIKSQPRSPHTLCSRPLLWHFARKQEAHYHLREGRGESSAYIRLLPAATVCHISNGSTCVDEDSQERAWATEAENSVCHRTEWGMGNYQSLVWKYLVHCIFKMVVSVQRTRAGWFNSWKKESTVPQHVQIRKTEKSTDLVSWIRNHKSLEKHILRNK